MIDKFDIQKISSLPIEQVADALGLKVNKHWSLCPFHSDSRPSLYYRVSKNKYRCFVCDHFGGPIDLTMHLCGMNFHDAVCWLAQTFGITISEDYQPLPNVKPRKVIPQKSDHQPIVLDSSQLAQMVANPTLTSEARDFLFAERHLDPRVVSWCGISSTHTHLLIPYYGVDGALQSIQWRYLGKHARPQLPDEPRFRFPKGSQCHIYNLPVLNLLRPSETLFIAEGCSDCWSLLSSGHKAIAIPSATLLSQKDKELLETLSQVKGTRFAMFPDNDLPGEKLFLHLREVLPNLVRFQLSSGCKDFSDYYLQKHLKPES